MLCGQVLAQRAKLNLRVGRCKEAVEDFSKLQKLNAKSADLSFQDSARVCQMSLEHAERAEQVSRCENVLSKGVPAC